MVFKKATGTGIHVLSFCIALCKIYNINYMKQKRLVINVTDLMLMIGISERTARRLMKRMKMYFNKEQSGLITVNEFCKFTGLDKDDVEEYLRWVGYYD